jgi:hypothetical protein
MLAESLHAGRDLRRSILFNHCSQQHYITLQRESSLNYSAVKLPGKGGATDQKTRRKTSGRSTCVAAADETKQPNSEEETRLAALPCGEPRELCSNQQKPSGWRGVVGTARTVVAKFQSFSVFVLVPGALL